MEQERTRAIREAAIRLFLRQGYARTQISHIAKETGVSVGTIYNEFVSKEALLRYILKCTISPEVLDRKLIKPIAKDLFPDLEQELIGALEQMADTLAENLTRAGWDYSFRDLLSDTFDRLSRHAAACLFIEKNPQAYPVLAAYYRQYREIFFTTMAAYLQAFQTCGQLRPMESPELTATLIIELLSWWAMDVRYISFETRDIPPEQAKKVCLDNLMAAYAAE